MRHALLSVVALVPLITGCAAELALSGKDLSGLTSREQVHEQFGTPIAGGPEKAGGFEQFRTRRKISDVGRAQRLGLGFCMLYGVPEIVYFPLELCRIGKHTVLGQDLRFCYDSAGRVSAVYLDGEELTFLNRPLPPSNLSEQERVPTQQPQKQP